MFVKSIYTVSTFSCEKKFSESFTESFNKNVDRPNDVARVRNKDVTPIYRVGQKVNPQILYTQPNFVKYWPIFGGRCSLVYSAVYCETNPSVRL